jgi:hypothetical protein
MFTRPSHSRIWILSKPDSIFSPRRPRLLIFSPILAPLTPTKCLALPPPPPTAAAGRDPPPRATRTHLRHRNPHRFPHESIQSAAFRICLGHSVRKFVNKAATFSLSLGSGPLFLLFLTPSTRLLLYRRYWSCFSWKGAVLGGPRSRIRLRRRRFDPKVRLPPNFISFVCVCVREFSFSASYMVFVFVTRLRNRVFGGLFSSRSLSGARSDDPS